MESTNSNSMTLIPDAIYEAGEQRIAADQTSASINRRTRWIVAVVVAALVAVVAVSAAVVMAVVLFVGVIVRIATRIASIGGK